jgi:hypothetical protein
LVEDLNYEIHKKQQPEKMLELALKIGEKVDELNQYIPKSIFEKTIINTLIFNLSKLFSSYNKLVQIMLIEEIIKKQREK